ncbi:MAG: NAD(P)-dependent oxidoreductase [Devosia sp.]|uniref:NAD(P)-dependent oxidoreductase n=1 Tax=Devosia sp. 66-22 TaxID=1895753 RepID=UPI0009275AF0|nr:NAD(P)-dependent oxidoreductase [Devosia sp. 66-22]MBN9347296.1 NAD(P)-dependent oxidoreductase [Devosia sp.]OJX49741.1 MAG: pyridine nucleotide transhydrogenase [Devosia sp. 66-22]
MRGLIGYSGFVGQTLLKQAKFDAMYRSTDISRINGKSFNLLVCAGAPAQKWRANKEPKADQASIDTLISHLSSVQAERLVLISTVDVFAVPRDVSETSEVLHQDLQAYGLHRRKLERFVSDHFPKSLIIRLPGLVGPGLRKNVLFDFRNSNNLGAIDSRHAFQFYPMVNLWNDIGISLSAGLQLIHLTAEPVSVSDIAHEAFGFEFRNTLPGNPVRYDMQSEFADLFGGRGKYQYGRRESLLAIRAYAQSEPRSVEGKAP